MASLRSFVRNYVNFNLNKHVCRLKIKNYERSYSVFPSTYVKPIFDKNLQKDMENTGQISIISHLPIKPSFSNETSSEFYDSTINKFINYLTKNGNKKQARNILEKTFENIKRIQLQRYNTTSENQDVIELDPKVILHKAIENSSPVLELLKKRVGGQEYQIPVPLTEKRSKFLAMNWLIKAGAEKKKQIHLPEKLANELIDAYANQGRVIKKKQELYRQCEANRSYAHYRWN